MKRPRRSPKSPHWTPVTTTSTMSKNIAMLMPRWTVSLGNTSVVAADAAKNDSRSMDVKKRYIVALCDSRNATTSTTAASIPSSPGHKNQWASLQCFNGLSSSRCSDQGDHRLARASGSPTPYILRLSARWVALRSGERLFDSLYIVFARLLAGDLLRWLERLLQGAMSFRGFAFLLEPVGFGLQ